MVILSLNVSIMHVAFHFTFKNGINRIGIIFCCIGVRSKRHTRSKMRENRKQQGGEHMKKRLLSFVLAVLMIASLLPATALAADVVTSGTCGAEGNGSNLTWTLDSEGLLTISGTGAMKDYAFYSNKAPWSYQEIRSAVIDNGVTSIGDYAFCHCDYLASVIIPNSVTSIGDSAFVYSSLTSVTIPSSVTSIGGSAFQRCSSLTSVTIPDSVTSIGDHAFYDCTSLTSVTIPNSVTSIGGYAFRKCTSLTGIWVAEGSSHYSSDAFGVLFNKDKTTLVQCPGAFAAYTIPNSVTSIDDGAFCECTSLKSVTIPDGVTSIGVDAFGGCASLISMTIPDSVTSIGDNAFAGCRSLTSVTIPNSVTSIGDNTFDQCTSLTSVAIPGSVTSIGRYAFFYCTSLTSVAIPDSVTSIGHGAFEGCASLTSVTIPDSVTSIGDQAFEGCASLTSVTIPNSVTSIGDFAFDQCDYLTSVTIPNSVTSIGDGAFRYCTSLTSVAIPNSVTSIGEWAFYGCGSLTDVYYAGSEAQWKAIQISNRYNENATLLNANIHYYSVDPGAYSSIYGADAQTRALTVYGNKNDSATIETNYQALPGVEASGGADKRTTGKDGKVTLQNDGSSVTFHKDGYVDRTLSAAALNVSADVYLQKASDYPVINAVWLNDVNDGHEHALSHEPGPVEALQGGGGDQLGQQFCQAGDPVSGRQEL